VLVGMRHFADPEMIDGHLGDTPKAPGPGAEDKSVQGHVVLPQQIPDDTEVRDDIHNGRQPVGFGFLLFGFGHNLISPPVEPMAKRSRSQVTITGSRRQCYRNLRLRCAARA